MDVKTLCLGVLTLGDASGYEIRKKFEEGPFAAFYDASYGSIYPALAKLLADGYVSVTEYTQSGKPAKKVYQLTEVGRAAFIAELRTPPAPDRIRSEHMVYLFFADYLEPRQLTAVFDAYHAHFESMATFLEGLGCDDLPLGRQFVRGFGRTFYRSLADYMDAHRDDLMGAAAKRGAETEAAE
ncbi:MAG: PadR family transcriptional regulator [Rhodospirillaceae bacterium]